MNEKVALFRQNNVRLNGCLNGQRSGHLKLWKRFTVKDYKRADWAIELVAAGHLEL
jgi:hypothetical protein